MKKFTILGIILLSLFMNACEESSTGPDDNPGVSKHNNYYPLSVGSWWEYHVDGMGGPSDTVRLETVNTLVDDQDRTWYGFWTLGASQNAYYRYDGDLLYFQDGKVMLKVNLIKGDVWSYADKSSYPACVYDTVKVKDVGMELSLFGTVYTDVAHVAIISNVVFYHDDEDPKDDEADGIRNETNYFYAKGIGMIQSITPVGREISVIDYHVAD